MNNQSSGTTTNEQPVLAWYQEIRSLLLQLRPGTHVERYPITLVGLSESFGARCSSFAATGATPVEAMTRLRSKLQEALNEQKNPAHVG